MTHYDRRIAFKSEFNFMSGERAFIDFNFSVFNISNPRRVCASDLTLSR